MAKAPKPPAVTLPTDLSVPYEVPEGLDVEQIDSLISQIRKDAEKQLGKDPNVEGANWLMDAAEALGGRKAELVEAQAARDAEVEAARQRLGANDPNAEQTDGDAEDSSDDEDDDDTRDGDEPNDEGTGGTGGTGDLNEAPTGEPVLVASARFAQRRASVVADAIKANRGKAPAFIADLRTKAKPREAHLTASAGARAFEVGQRIDWSGAGAIADDRFAKLNPGRRGGQAMSLPIASIHVPSDDGLVASGAGSKGRDGLSDYVNVDEQIAWALSGERLRRETGSDSLTAAGGWCAPSETLYDLLDISAVTGMINLPGITVNRGGVRYSLGPDFTAVWSAGQNFTKTEAQAIAGSTKPVVNIPCPSFADHRMVVDGLYLTGDILSQRGYPEAYADYLAKSATAFAHYVNMQTIADMVALATHVDLTQPAGTPPSPLRYEAMSASTELLSAIELQALDMHYKNRTAPGNLELVLPEFARGLIRADMMRRAAVDNPAAISNADIDGFFADRGVNVQYVLDWQDAFSGVSTGFGASTAIAAWPTSVDFLLYPAGGFVRALSDVIELSAVYDSVLLQTNQYVALFMEQARLTLQRTFDTRRVTVPTKVTGATGAAIDYTARQPTV